MCRTQCVLALAALYVGLAHSWDIVVSQGDELMFYTNGSKTDTVFLICQRPAALAYDEVHNMILYVDKQIENDAISGYDLHSKEYKCFINRKNGNIHSIAFDPATETLFFTDTNERSINWISLKPGFNNNVYGNLLIKMDDRTPTDIAVDSYRGYIYWTNTNVRAEEYIERARFNSSEREVIYGYLPVFSIAVDPQTRKLYYFDGYESWFLNRIDLDRRNERHVILSDDIYLSEPKELTVLYDYLYWMNSSESYTTVWRIAKNAMGNAEPKEISKINHKSSLGLAVNHNIKNQIQDYEPLSNLVLPSNSIFNIRETTKREQTTEYTTVAELFCVHGVKDSETSVCKCIPGYIGERCDVSVCENHCMHGDCSFDGEGLPKCRCKAGYSGERCELNACHGYCLNNGDCSLNEENEPVCQCVGYHEGTRCEAVKYYTSTFTNRNLTLLDLLSNWQRLLLLKNIVID